MNQPDLDHMDFPTCPHCGEEEEAYWELMDVATGDGDEMEYECGQCGGSVTVEVHMTMSFSTIT